MVLILLCLTIGVISLIEFALFIKQRRAAIERFKQQCKIPLVGEPGLFGGNLLQFVAKPNNCELIKEFHEKLGPTYGLFYGPDPWVMTIDLDLIQRIFVTEGSVHIDATQLRLPFVTEINESLVQVNGDRWREMRRIMGPSFTLKSMKSDNVFRDINNVCDLFIDMLEQTKTSTPASRSSSSSSSSEFSHGKKTKLMDKPSAETPPGAIAFDVCYAFKKYTLEVICRVAFGAEHCQKLSMESRDEIIDSLDEAAHMVNGTLVYIGIMFSFAQRLLGFCSQFTPLGHCIKHVHSIIDKNLRQRWQLARGQRLNRSTNPLVRPGADRKLIDSLIERFDLSPNKKAAEETLKANLFFILLAGHETSANTLAVMFWLLAKHQDHQEKLRQSIASGDGGGGGGGGGNGKQAHYLDWVIWETLRLYPAVPAAVGRILEHDIEHNGVQFQRGTTIIASTWTLHRWRQYWGDDVNQFRPERFGEPSEWLPVRFFAFGEGPRYCIGKHLAMTEMRAIASRLLVRYRVTLCSDSPKSLRTISPNLIHFIIEHPIKLAFTRITTL